MSICFFKKIHEIGNRSRKGMTLIPCPWINQGESEGLMGTIYKIKFKDKNRNTKEGKTFWIRYQHS